MESDPAPEERQHRHQADDSNVNTPHESEDVDVERFRHFFRTQKHIVGDPARGSERLHDAAYEDLLYDFPQADARKLSCLASWMWESVNAGKFPSVPQPITPTFVKNVANQAMKRMVTAKSQPQMPAENSSSLSLGQETKAEEIDDHASVSVMDLHSEDSVQVPDLEITVFLGLPSLLLSKAVSVKDSYAFTRCLQIQAATPSATAVASAAVVAADQTFDSKSVGLDESTDRQMMTCLEEKTKLCEGGGSEEQEIEQMIENPDPDDFVYEEDPPSDEEESGQNPERQTQPKAQAVSYREMCEHVEQALLHLLSWWKKDYLCVSAEAWRKDGPAFNQLRELLAYVQTQPPGGVFTAKGLSAVKMSAARLLLQVLETFPQLIPHGLKFLVDKVLTMPEEKISGPEKAALPLGEEAAESTVARAKPNMSNLVISKLSRRAISSIVSRTGAVCRCVRVAGKAAWKGFGSDSHFHLWMAAQEYVPEMIDVMTNAANCHPEVLSNVATVCLYMVTPSPWDEGSHGKRVEKLLFKNGLLAALSSCCRKSEDSSSSPHAAGISVLRWALLVAAGTNSKAKSFVSEVPELPEVLLSKQLHDTSRAEAILWSILLADSKCSSSSIQTTNNRQQQHSRGKLSRKSLLSSTGKHKSKLRPDQKKQPPKSGHQRGPSWSESLSGVIEGFRSEIGIDGKASSSQGSGSGALSNFDNSKIVDAIIKGLLWSGCWNSPAGKKAKTQLDRLHGDVSTKLTRMRSSIRERQTKRNNHSGLDESHDGHTAETADLPAWNAKEVQLVEHLRALDAQLKDLKGNGTAGGKAD